MKTLHRLKPRVKLLNDFFVLDTETGIRNKDGSIQWHLNARPESFIFGVIYGYNFSKVIYSVKEFKEELLDSRYRNKKIFMHNAEYDLGVLYENIITGLDPEAIFNGKFISATNGNCHFADSTNIFGRIKLADLAEKIGRKKPALGNDKLFSKSLGPEEINRCYMDCLILWEALINIFEFAGDIKITQASLSLTYFRRHHQVMNIQHNDNASYFWDSYYGGRTECFKMGKTYSKCIDINSSYPYAMVNCIFPNPKFLKYEVNVKPQKLINYYLQYFEGCAYCEIEHAETWLGFLPHKMDIKKQKKLLFPIGNFSGCWNFNELRFALEHKAITIKKVTKVVYAERMESPFKSYVEYLYKERTTSTDEFEKYRIKIFMNSLYGKFAQRISEENIYIENIDKQYHIIEEAQRKGIFKKLQLFNAERLDAFLIIKSMTGKSVSHAIPSFSSYITSFSRIHLLKKLLEMEKFNPVYCDTDSIFYEIDPGIQDEYKLGGWKVEGKIVTEILGLKNYKFFKTSKPETLIHRIKGVPTKHEKIGKNEFTYTNLIKTKEGLRRNLDSGVLTKRTKKILGLYDKRIVTTNGHTKPIKL